MEKEILDLKEAAENRTLKSKEKTQIFVKLCKKYIKKIKNLVNLITKLESNSPISESKTLLVNELTTTIEKFFNTVYNPKLLDTLTEGVSQTNESNKRKFLEESEDESYFDNQVNLIEIVQNLEKQVHSLENQNEGLRKRRMMVEPELQERRQTENYEEQIIELKRNYSETKRKYEDEIRSLKKKISSYEADNNKLNQNNKLVKSVLTS